MFKDVLAHANLSFWAEAGLVIFFVTFAGIALWALSRSGQTVDRWSRLPLSGSDAGDEHE